MVHISQAARSHVSFHMPVAGSTLLPSNGQDRRCTHQDMHAVEPVSRVYEYNQAVHHDHFAMPRVQPHATPRALTLAPAHSAMPARPGPQHAARPGPQHASEATLHEQASPSHQHHLHHAAPSRAFHAQTRRRSTLGSPPERMPAPPKPPSPLANHRPHEFSKPAHGSTFCHSSSGWCTLLLAVHWRSGGGLAAGPPAALGRCCGHHRLRRT